MALSLEPDILNNGCPGQGAPLAIAFGRMEAMQGAV
jgi:hypothetical protein